jgi:hypothetical protein
VQLKDATGNDLTVGGDAVTLATTLGTLGPVTDNGDGSYAATLTSGTTVGAALVTGTVNGVTITDDANITLTTPSATTGRLDTAAPNNGLSTDGSGIFVDLTATSGNLVVTEIGMVSYGSTGTPIRLRVWRREGTYVGFDGASSGWSVVDQVDATSAGRDDPTTFVLNNPIDLTQGQVTGFLFEGEIGGVRYTGPTSSQTTWTDANLTLFSDRSRGILFGGFVNAPRNFSGYIQYSGSTPPPASAGRIR